MSLRQSYGAALVLGIVAALVPAACNEAACEPGADGCPCDMSGSCAAGLACIQGWCQAGDVGMSATVSTQPGTSSSASASTSGGSTTGGDASTSGGSSTGDTTGEMTTAGAEPTIPAYLDHALIEAGEARDVEITPSGQLAIVGFVEREMFDRDAWIGVFGDVDTLLWERTVDGEDGHADEFNGVAVDGGGIITATGKKDLLVGWDDVLTLSLDPQGAVVQERGYGNEFKRDDVGYDVAVDGDGNVYVCGFLTYEDNFTGTKLAYTKRYADFSGVDWFNYSGLLEEAQFDCEAGPSGYLVTVGIRKSFASLHRFAVDGDSVYRHEYAFPGASSTVPWGLAIDPEDDSLYVAGYATGFPGSKPWLGKWDWAGDKVWVSELEMAGDKAGAWDVAIDGDGWLRVVGSDHIDGAWAIVITTLGPDGVEHDRQVWSPPEAEVRALGAAIRGDSLYVVGGTGNTDADSKVLLVEFGI